ncbi:MAG: acetyl/propionyl/methylcrotonyl-CoA carboxylase subunit alpha [Rubrimonas sp.]|uniref:acetyl/propionyl/methylcrotonyl-CoA carboxylase subunit alpha n=1 Tax=Rubrimonas sp. TaxID=2036015 RepID=UPI002FDE5923
MIARLLIANRGEIAVRIARTCRRLGVSPVAVFSEADAASAHVAACDAAHLIGPAPAAESYLRIDALLAAARAACADAVHPGYGFLSENADFAEAVIAAGLIWVGPPPSAIRAMGLKDAAKARMQAAGVPVVPGYHGAEQDPRFLAGAAEEIGYPVLIKARAGGGGKGMRRVDRPEDFAEALASAQSEARAAFGDPAVLIEKFVGRPRHLEVQIFADFHGGCVHLGERDCSLQRRHQKVIEEAPAPGVDETLRAEIGAAAVRAARAVGYVGAGTVEFIADATDGLRPDRIYFMEMNTRLQVEHPVTEAIYGVDLVEWQLRIAEGSRLPRSQDQLVQNGWAVEARLYAEDPATGFLPSTGRLAHLRLPDGVRVDAGVRSGDAVSPHYDPMIAKLIAHAPDRASALAKLRAALAETEVAGVATNAGFLARLLAHPDVIAGEFDTGLIARAGSALADAPPPTADAWALAALDRLGLTAPAADPDPWSARDGWRLWGEASAVATLAHGGAEASVRLTRDAADWRAETPAGAARLSAKPEGDALRIVSGAGARRACAVRIPLGAVIFLDGEGHRFGHPQPEAAEEAGPGGDALRAPMPGLVKAVHVSPGEAVAAGARLVTLEAMKMEHALRSPRDGVVAEIAAQPGDQVEEGALLAALAPEA